MRRIFEWYQKFGCERKDKFQIGADWLDRIESITERWNAISKSFASGKKGCLAVWGPSQSGKSTLLSGSIDGILDDGSDSALTWPRGVNARFSPKDAETTMANPDTVILNPFHQGHDASGVPTRYTMRKSVEHPSHPVEFTIASQAQIMHAISAGYLYECDPVDIKGFRQSWDQSKIEGLISELPDGGKSFSIDAFRILRDGMSCIEGMIKAGESRFSNLDAGGTWHSLRRQIIARGKLVNSTENAIKFIQTILWDNHESLNQLFQNIINKRKELNRIWGETPSIFCSIELAALLLDISALDTDQTNVKASRVNWRRNGEVVFVDLSATGSPELSGDAFGLFQALCGELVVPINEANISKNRFKQFMTKNDLLDFPGVPQGGEAAEDVLLNPAKLTVGNREDMRVLLTRLFKRGKTISMVAAKSREISIDSFLILSRTALPVSKPRIINSGIQQWLRSFDNGFAGLSPTSRPPLPIHVNLTFFAQAVANVAINGASDLVKVATHLDTLGNVALPGNATFHLTNYPHLPPGVIPSIDREQVRRAIHNNAKFKERLPNTADCVDAILDSPDGGTELLFERLCSVDYRKRVDLYRQMINNDKFELLSLIEAHLPSTKDDIAERLHRVVDTAVKALNNALQEWGKEKSVVIRIGNGVKALCEFPTSLFDDLPGKNYENYVIRHFEKWSSDRTASNGKVEWFFTETLKISEQSDRRLLCEALYSSCKLKKVVEQVSELASPPPKGWGLKVSELRLVLSSLFSNAILYGDAQGAGERKSNPNFLDAQEPDEYDQVPHYPLLIEPFLQRLEHAKNATPVTRPPQPGDDKLEELKNIDFYSSIISNLP